MKKFTLSEYQLKIIKRHIESCSEDVENFLLEKYGVFGIDELPSSLFDEITEDIIDFSAR